MAQKLHPTKIYIAANTRTALVSVLNARLADSVDLATQMKQAHWNVKGPNFIALHELFDTIHGEIQVRVDDLAERITALGGTALGTAAVAVEKSRLPAYPLDAESGADHVEAVSTVLAAFGKSVRTAIDECAEIGDADTEDLFTGISRDVDKNLWFVEAHAQGRTDRQPFSGFHRSNRTQTERRRGFPRRFLRATMPDGRGAGIASRGHKRPAEAHNDLFPQL